MKIIITSPSLDVNKNVAGISAVTHFITKSNIQNEYIHFELGKKDNEIRNLLWLYRILKAYMKWIYLLVAHRRILIHFNLALAKPSIIRDCPLIIIARIFKERMIIHLHGGDYLMHKKMPAWMKYLLKLSFSGKNPKIVLGSLEEEALTQKLGIKNVHVLPNCIVLDEANHFQRKYNEHESLRLLFLGRITEDKGIEYIFQALKSLRQKGAKFRFILAGKGPKENYYVQRFTQLLGADFEFTGVVSGSRKTEILKYCNVFLLPSFFEGLPMALLECMSFGLVPVTTDLGSIKHVINNGENGLIVRKYSSEDIISALEILSANEIYMQELSKNACQYIFSHYNPEEYVMRLNKIYTYA